MTSVNQKFHLLKMHLYSSTLLQMTLFQKYTCYFMVTIYDTVVMRRPIHPSRYLENDPRCLGSSNSLRQSVKIMCCIISCKYDYSQWQQQSKL